MENAGFLPTRITAGETVYVAAANTHQSWAGQDITFDSYTPAGGYTLAYQFAAATPITVSAVANGANTGWTLTVTAAQTFLFAPGRLHFAAYVTDSSSMVFAVDGGIIDVLASPLRVSDWAARLASVDAAIGTLAANTKTSVSIDGVSYTYRDIKQLIELRDFIKARLAEDTSDRPVRIIRSRLVCSH